MLDLHSTISWTPVFMPGSGQPAKSILYCIVQYHALQLTLISRACVYVHVMMGRE